MEQLNHDDLKAAIQREIINEQQYSAIVQIAKAREFAQKNLADEDEPFAIFLGFSEIFISIGLCILYAGTLGVLAFLSSPFASASLMAILSILLSHYFIKKRRMVLPSIIATSAFAITTIVALITMAEGMISNLTPSSLFVCSLIVFCLLIVMFRFYRFPYLAFIAGCTGLMSMLSLGGLVYTTEYEHITPTKMLDLTVQPALAASILLFGLITLIIGLYFDFRDPHRIGNASKTAFWLHLLAGPALLNVFAFNLYYDGNLISYALTAILLCLFVIIALVIDRRSFISTGIIYMSFLLSWATKSIGIDTDYISLFILGLAITVLATWWHAWRHRLMNFLPEFRFKDRLPPY
ncbi:MAG: hypothetical protein HWE30_03350 [Methylocystaceae bacterium]|nr:hypothetical protein [Methylocystaceae bacterium]